MASYSPPPTRSRPRDYSPPRGRSRTRLRASRSPYQSRSRRRSISPRSASISRSRHSSSFSSPYGRRNGRNSKNSHRRSRSRNFSRTRGRTESRVGRRSLSRGSVPPPRSAKIVVEKLTKNVNEEHLREIFGVYGSIKDLDLPINRQFMTNRGTAYVLYHTPAAAESAIARMHEAQLDGAVINVSIVIPRHRFSSTPPPRRNPVPIGRPPRGPPSTAGGRYRSPLRRRSPPRDYGRPGRGSNWYRPRSFSRSRSPPRMARSRSYSSRSSSISPPPRRVGRYRRRDSPPRGGRRRRSPSYSSYSSYSCRSRSRGARVRR